jgi:biopolymer transport protein ExbD
VIHLGRRQRSMPEIGIAPLVDCVFLLLIFFLLTSSFSRKQAIDITLPVSGTAAPQEGAVIEIAVSDNGEIEFDRKLVELEHLGSVLELAVQRQGKKPVLLVADRQVSLEMLTKLIDCIRGADLESVAIATRPGRAGKGAEQEAME